MDSLISRQAAIDAIMELVNFATVEELRNWCSRYLSAQWGDGIVDAIDVIQGLPSAQPERSEQDILAWLLAYHAQSFELNGRYMAHEVIGWLVHDFAAAYMAERREE